MARHMLLLFIVLLCGSADALIGNWDIQRGHSQKFPLSAASAQFGVDLLRSAANASESLVLSPLSLGCAMAIVHDATRGNSKKQLSTVLANGTTPSAVATHYSSLMKNIAAAKNVQTSVANRFFLDMKFNMNYSYALHVRKQYSARIEKMNFNWKEGSAFLVNAFVSGETRGMIKEIVQPSFFENKPVALLVNAVYFKGDWNTQFSSGATSDRAFHGVLGDRQIPFMWDNKISCQYKSANGLSVLSLPFKDTSYAMVIVMPDADFASWRENLTGNALLAAISDLQSADVNVRLPKFKIESQLDGKKALIEMGVTDIFGDNADFGGMTSEPIRISDIIQKATIDVNEEGTEAAAATVLMAVAQGFISGGPAPPIFVADRPFLYGIVHNNNFIFLGQFC